MANKNDFDVHHVKAIQEIQHFERGIMPTFLTPNASLSVLSFDLLYEDRSEQDSSGSIASEMPFKGREQSVTLKLRAQNSTVDTGRIEQSLPRV